MICAVGYHFYFTQDAQREGETQIYHYANSTVKVRTGGPPKPKVDPQARRFAKWKEEFGGGEKGEKLVKTLKKLHEGTLKVHHCNEFIMMLRSRMKLLLSRGTKVIWRTITLCISLSRNQ